MADRTVAETSDIQLTKRADELKPGDRIASGFLYHGEPVEVRFVEPYDGDTSPVPWSLVVHRRANGVPDVDFFLAAAHIPVEPAADLTGLDFSREPDATEAGTVADGIEGGPLGGHQAHHPDDCGWMTPTGPCHLIRDHPLFPLGPREDSGHISKASAEANRARIAARETT